jgi:hypothetical protein
LALGGWIGGGGTSVADRYGNGFSVPQLFEALSKMEVAELDLSHLRGDKGSLDNAKCSKALDEPH